ncbi:MAG: hypothetical protein P8178_15140 [Candidatus Thiodiazotropha sp.]
MPGILFDLDGVFYVGDRAVPGAADTLAWVQREGIPHCFLTNTTSKPRQALLEKTAGSRRWSSAIWASAGTSPP